MLAILMPLLMGQPNTAQAHLSVVWKKPPKTLVRGRHFVWQGAVRGLPDTLLRRGVAISFLLMQSQRTIRLGQVPVNPKGEFVLEGVVSYQLSPQEYSLDVRILVPQAQPSRTQKQGKAGRKGQPGRTGQRRQGRRRTSVKAGLGKGRLAPPVKGSPDSNNYESLPLQPRKPGQTDLNYPNADNSPESSEPNKFPGGDKPPAKGKSSKTASGFEGRKGPALPPQAQRRSKNLSKTLQQGWKATQRKVASRRNTVQPGSFKTPSFLLPPIQPGTQPKKKGQSGSGKTKSGQSNGSTTPGADPSSGNPLSPNGKMPNGENRVAPDGRKTQANRAPVGQNSDQGSERPKSNDFQVDSYPRRRRRGNGNGSSERPYAGQRDNSQGAARQGEPAGQGGGSVPTPGGRFEPSLDGAEPPPEARRRPDHKPPMMVPPLTSNLSDPLDRRRRRKPVNPHKDSLIWNRSQHSKLDLNTDMGNTYLRQVFEPYIPHLQRISVFSRVRSNFLLDQIDSNKRRLNIGGRRKAGRSYFVGRVRVVLWRRRWTPIPSVSPEARILWYRTTPNVPLIFARDKGDLMYVRARRWKTPVVYLEFGTDGSRGYFGGQIPENIRTSMYSRRMRPYVPYNVRRVALKHMRRFGVHRGMPLHEILRSVVPYLRSFVARKLKPYERKSNPFATLWRSRVGVCRHRSMLFVMAMQSLGFPARMVANRAHAFAEIQYPNGRWRQIDLGGGEVPHWMGKWQGNKYKKPKDPFPKPPDNPTRRKDLPTTPNPPPHAPDPDSNQVPGVRTPGKPGQGSFRRGQSGDSGQRMRLVPGLPPKFKRRRRKKRKPYSPHTRF